MMSEVDDLSQMTLDEFMAMSGLEQNIFKLAASGWSVRKIGEELKISKDKVHRVEKKYGTHARESIEHMLIKDVVAEYLVNEGYTVKKEEYIADPSTREDGIMDIVAEKDGERIIIECLSSQAYIGDCRFDWRSKLGKFVIALPEKISKAKRKAYTQFTSHIWLVDVMLRQVTETAISATKRISKVSQSVAPKLPPISPQPHDREVEDSLEKQTIQAEIVKGATIVDLPSYNEFIQWCRAHPEHIFGEYLWRRCEGDPRRPIRSDTMKVIETMRDMLKEREKAITHDPGTDC